MGGIHHQHVHPGFHQCRHPFFGTVSGTHGGAYPQATLVVFTGQGICLSFQQVGIGDHALEMVGVVHQQDLFNAVFVQQLFDLFGASPFFGGNQLVLGCHDGRDRLVIAVFEAQIPTGDYTHQLLAFHHGHPGDIVDLGDFDQLTHRSVRGHGDGVTHHTAFIFLNRPDLTGLFLGSHVLVQNADTTFLRHADRQAVFSNGVHRRRNQGDIQGNVTGKPGLELHIPWQNLRVTGQ